MECDVVLNVQITAVDLALHPVAQALDTLDVLVGSVQRCHLGHARFQQQAHVHQIQCQCVLVLHAAQVQWVRKALGSRDHIGARAAPHLHDALAGKQLHRFAHRAAAHAELFAQFKFIGQLGSRLQRGIQNIVVNFVLHLFGKEFVFQMGKFAHGCSLPCFLSYYKAGQQTKARAVLIHRQPLLIRLRPFPAPLPLRRLRPPPASGTPGKPTTWVRCPCPSPGGRSSCG